MKHMMPSTLGRIQQWPELGEALYDRAGTLIHRNREFSRQLEASHSALVLERAADRMARALAMLLAPGVPVEGACLRQEIRLAGRRCVLTASAENGRSILVSIEPAPAAAESPALARYGLTDREYEVACLVSQGASNKEVAAELGISEKTSRKHTDAVLRKLGVNSRGKIAPLLMAAGGPGVMFRVA